MKLLVFAHTPPPHHGQSFMVQLLLEGLGGDARTSPSRKPGEIQCFHVNGRFSEGMDDIGTVRAGKLFFLFFYCMEAIWCRFRYGVRTLYYVPAPGKRSALYRDWLVMLLCRPFFPRLILHWHASGLGAWLESTGSPLERAITQALLGRPTLSVALASASSHDALWLRSKKVLIVPNGIPDPCPDFATDLLCERQTRARERALRLQAAPEPGEAPVEWRVLYLSHCIREKGLFDSLEGVALFNQRNSGVRIHLTVAGAFMEESEEREFRDRIAQADLAGAVTYAGFISGGEKKALLQQSDCLCFPTYYHAESFPLTIVEGLAYGIPCVTTRWRAIPEILPPAYPGYVDPQAPAQIADAFEHLAGVDLTQSLRERYLAQFSSSSHIEQMTAALKKAEHPAQTRRDDARTFENFHAPPAPSASPTHLLEPFPPIKCNVLQIFSRYLQYGGEEGSFLRIGDALMEEHEVEFYIQSTAKLLGKGRWRALGKVMCNRQAAHDLRRLQEIGHFDLWQIHNVFPALSPEVYREAFRLGMPVVHYLHNYRMGCINGFFLNHGKPCQACLGGNFIHAAKTRCWHESRLICSWMGLVMKRVKMLDVFHKVTRWVALSEAQKAVHVEMGIPEERIDVIHHFYEPKGPALPPPEEGYALFLGRLSAEKGCMELLKAWRAMPPGRKLVIAGDGPELPALRNYAATAGLANVEFAGFIPKAQQDALWRGAAFLVVPSIWMEPFGMVVLEAWSRGRAVVAHAIGALPEIITHGKTGFLVPPSVPEALASEMERLFQNPDLLKNVSAQAERELKTRFSKSEWRRKINRTYSKALSQHH